MIRLGKAPLQYFKIIVITISLRTISRELYLFKEDTKTDNKHSAVLPWFYYICHCHDITYLLGDRVLSLRDEQRVK